MKIRENESKTLLATQKLGGDAQVEQIMKESGLSHATIMRTALALQHKNLAKIIEKPYRFVRLNDEGRIHAKNGLPERRLVNALIELGGKATIKKTCRKAKLESQFVPLALGWLRRKRWVTLNGETDTLELLEEPKKREDDEELLRRLNKEEQLVFEQLSHELQLAAENLKRRKLLEIIRKTDRTIKITDVGRKRIEKGIEVRGEVTQLTSELIVAGKWRKVRLVDFDVEAPGPTVYPAKMHPVQQMIQRVKEIFAEMGFTEIRGPIIETAFWNFDALFQPQDHPAREMHDTFYLAYPKSGKLPEESVVAKVAKTHENGWKTGSTGWQYTWSPDEAKKLIFRTHTTSTTIRYLADHMDPPVKVFSVDRAYRNEKMDYKSLCEFHQIEGIIMDRKVTLRDLIGTLKEFYLKLGLKKVRFWPSYFPYTEPSAQSTVYIPEHKKWFELCGMGMFRPEVLAPFGIKHPVLAWGGGLERLIMLKLGVEDIRRLYKNNLGWIRRTALCR